MKIKLEIEPKATPRPRVSRMGGVWYPGGYVRYKYALAILIKQAKIPAGDYRELMIWFWFAYPKSTPKKHRIQDEKRQQELPLFKTREEYIEWVKTGLNNQKEIARLREENKRRRARWTGHDPAFEAEVMRLKLERKKNLEQQKQKVEKKQDTKESQSTTTK